MALLRDRLEMMRCCRLSKIRSKPTNNYISIQLQEIRDFPTAKHNNSSQSQAGDKCEEVDDNGSLSPRFKFEKKKTDKTKYSPSNKCNKTRKFVLANKM